MKKNEANRHNTEALLGKASVKAFIYHCACAGYSVYTQTYSGQIINQGNLQLYIPGGQDLFSLF